MRRVIIPEAALSGILLEVRQFWRVYILLPPVPESGTIYPVGRGTKIKTGGAPMSTDSRLLQLIRSSADPERAVEIALTTILDSAGPPRWPGEAPPASPPGHPATAAAETAPRL